MKKALQEIFALILCVGLCLSFVPTAGAAYIQVMTANEFVNYLTIAANRETRYGEGYPYNVGYYNGEYISWDCWNLGKTIIATRGATVNNYTQGTYSACSDTSIGLYDTDGDGLENACGGTLSNDFSNIVSGEWLFKENSSGYCYHVGYYIGNGRVIEATSDGSYNLQISTIDKYGRCGNIGGRGSTWSWTFHGKVPWIDYSEDSTRGTTTILRDYSAGVAPGQIRYVSQNSNLSANGWGAYAYLAGGECGYASQSMALSYLGKDVSPEYLCYGEYAQGKWQTNYAITYDIPGISVVSGSGAKSGSDALNTINTMLSNYIDDNNTGYYSPVVIHYRSGSTMHAIIIVGKNTDRVYIAVDPAKGMTTYSFSISSSGIVSGDVTYGPSELSIDRVEQYQLTEPTPHAPQATLDNAEGGVGTVYVRGWSFDRDALDSSVPIHVYVGGPAGSGAEGYEIFANTFREDVNEVFPGVGNYHGFDSTINVNSRGTQTLYFYACDLGGGPGNQLFATTTVTITEPKTYSINYNANGGTGAPGSQTKTHGSDLILSSTEPTHENSSAGSYTVTLDANGGSVSPTSLDAARTTNYTFKGWNTAANGSGTSYAPGTTYSFDTDITLYAQWDVQTTILPITLPAPNRDHYVFRGWADSSSSEVAQYREGDQFTPGSNVTLYALWEEGTLSDWSEIKPTNVDEQLIETKTQYRFRDKQTTTGTESTMSGWTLENTEQVWGEYGPWSEWQDSAITQNESTKVETRTIYPYYYFYCTNCGTGARYPYWGSSLRCEICGNTGTRPLEANFVEWFENPWSDSIVWGNDSAKYYQYINGEIWWNWTDGASPKTQYRASTRSTEDIYHFYRWSDWSSWSDIETTESDTREIETRSLYRYVIKKYTVTYNANGGTGAPANQTKTFDQALTLSATVPTRDGFFFIGWAETANANAATYQPGGSFTKDDNVTLYAVWIKPDLTLPASLTTIESEAFAGGGFNSVLIPPTVKTIAPDAFGDRTDLIILGTSGSYAETFAGEKHFTFVPAA